MKTKLLVLCFLLSISELMAQTPVISVLTGSTTFCAGGSVTLQSSAVSGNRWYKNGIATNNYSTTLVATTSGVYSVKVNNIFSQGTQVTSLPLPSSAISPAGSSGVITICAGSSVNLSATYAGAGGSYLWSTGDTTRVINVNSSGTFWVIVTNANGCWKKSSTKTVAVSSIPLSLTASAMGSTTFCSGSSVTLQASPAIGYRWFKNGAAISGATASTYIATASGNYTVKAFNGYCYSPASNIINVNAVAQPAAITPAGTNNVITICAGSSVNLTASYAGVGGSYLWSTGATTRVIQVNTAGSYWVKVTNSLGCSRTSVTKTTVLAPLPSALTANALGAITFCHGGSVVLQANGSASGYRWFRNNSAISGATSPTYTATLAGTYTVKAFNGTCYSLASNGIVVKVNALPVTTITQGSTVNVCNGQTATLTSSSAGSGGSYLWSTGATTQSISVNTSGQYSVTVTKSNGCSKTSSATTVNIASPVPAIVAGGPTIFCQGDSVILTSAQAADYLWSTGDTSRSIKVTQTGNYTVSISDVYGCTATSSPFLVTVNTLPTVNAGSDQQIFLGYGNQSANLVCYPTGNGPFNYSWSTGESDYSITVSPNETTVYSATVSDQNGCSASDNVLVAVTDVRCGNDSDKVLICHTTGNGNYGTICISKNAIPIHLAHGDQLGDCTIEANRFAKRNDAVTSQADEFIEKHITFKPNPFDENAIINYLINEDSKVIIELYNVLGVKVKTIANERQMKGEYSLPVNFLDDHLASDLYLLKILINNEISVIRILKNR